MRGQTLLALALAAALNATPLAARATSTPPRVEVLQVGSTTDRQVSVLASVGPIPLPPLTESLVSISAGGTDVPAQVRSVLSDRSAFGVVVDASTTATESLLTGGQSGIAGFLLQIPPGSSSTVIADRRPPTVAAAPSVGVVDDLQALSDLRTGGPRATAEAVTLALRQFPARSDVKRVVVLYTTAPDAGGVSARSLGDRVRAAGALLSVVCACPDVGYWSHVATGSGGVAVTTGTAHPNRAFDQVADALRARYVVTFPRPPADTESATLRVSTGGAQVEVPVRLSDGNVSTTSARAGTAGDAGGPAHVWWWVLGVSAAAAAALVVAISRRRRAGRSADASRRAEQDDTHTLPPGVRIFDVAQPGAPREITDLIGNDERHRYAGRDEKAP